MQMDRGPMRMIPLPAGHAAQVRVAPLPETMGWAASHSAQHTEHEVDICIEIYKYQSERPACLRFDASQAAARCTHEPAAGMTHHVLWMPTPQLHENR